MKKWMIISIFGITASMLKGSFNGLDRMVLASEAGWHQDSKGWWYENADGVCERYKWKMVLFS